MSWRRGRLQTWLWWWPLALLALVPMLASYLGNRFEVSAQDLVLPVIVEVVTAAVVGLAYLRLWRGDRVAAYAAGVLATLVLASNVDARVTLVYPLLQAFTPITELGPLESTLFTLGFAVIVLLLAGWLGRLFSAWARRRGWKMAEVLTAITIAVTVTFAFEFAVLARDLALEWSQFFYRPQALPAATAQASSKPDIYYIVLDRYASPAVLQQQFGFDDSDFTSFLTDKGYHINPDAHNNYPYTTMSIASTMQADYLTDIVSRYSGSPLQTTIPFNETIRSSPVAQALKSRGYSYQLIGNWYETSNLSWVADTQYVQNGILTILGKSVVLNNFSKISLINSLFGHLVGMGLQIGSFKILTYENQGDVDMTHNALTELRAQAGKSTGGRFIFAHILVPHDPYYFNADGSLNANNSTDNIGQPLKTKYVNQVKYINGQMRDILSRIDASSGGKAVVVLQSDEGPYPFQINDDDFDQTKIDSEIGGGDMRKWNQSDLRLKYGNLAAYRLPNVDMTANADAADSVNIFRLVLNSYLGYSLPYRPDCYYAYPNGREQPLVFASITEKLTGQAEDGRCGATGGLK